MGLEPSSSQHSHSLKRKHSLASPLCKAAGKKGRGKAQLIKPKDGWPEGRVGRQNEHPQLRSLPSTEAGLVKITAVGLRWSSYHSLSKRLRFLPPLLFS